MSDLLRPDNHELFDAVRKRLNQRDPVVPIAMIAWDLGVTVDELCKWIMAYKEPRKPKAYQSPRFPAIGAPLVKSAPEWAQGDSTRRFLAWKRAHDGAVKARKALEAANAG
jgi:hypothetical protein